MEKRETKQQDSDTVVVCYLDGTSEDRRYAEIPESCIEEWARTHPGSTVTHMFRKDGRDDTGHNSIERVFLLECGKYGMSTGDLGRKYTDHRGHVVRLAGIRPGTGVGRSDCRLVVQDLTTGTTLTVCPEYVRAAKPIG